MKRPAMKKLAAVLLPLTVAVFLALPAHLGEKEPVSRETATSTAPVQQPVIPYTGQQKRLYSEVQATFDDIPQMTAIVRCESSFRQFHDDGSPLISPTGDVGVAQINIKTWGAEAKALGLDIFGSAADNLAMARIVLKEQGLTAWTCYTGG